MGTTAGFAHAATHLARVGVQEVLVDEGQLAKIVERVDGARFGNHHLVAADGRHVDVGMAARRLAVGKVVVAAAAAALAVAALIVTATRGRLAQVLLQAVVGLALFASEGVGEST